MDVPTQLHIGSFTACVVVEGKELPLYGVEYSGDQATCWLPSEAGKEFGVRWKDAVGSCPTKGRIFVDGQQQGARTCRPGDANTDPWTFKDYCRVSQTTVRKFKFAKIQTTEDDTYLDQVISKDFGTVVLNLAEVRFLGRDVPRRYTLAPQILDKVHERSKKAMGHQMQLGLPTKNVAKSMVSAVKSVRQLASFTFRYRPEAFLQANGIMPRSNLSADRDDGDIIDLTLDSDDAGPDDAQVDQRIQELEKELLKLKEKKQRSGPSVKREVKVEPRLN